MRKLNYIAPLWSIFIIYSNMLFSQKPAQSTDLEIVNSKPYKTEKMAVQLLEVRIKYYLAK
ncbi:MAG: hypothetical protein IPG12_09300 [Saprospiraceae bacterium]|nr:hypothetical protein [Saprospiraceae bacterium]